MILRKDMNVLLRIKRDKDIVKIEPPSIEEVEDFADETGPGPKLVPMRLSFDITAGHAWNLDLAKQFVEAWMKHRNIHGDEEAIVYELFNTCFLTLKRRYRAWQLQDGEEDVRRKQHVKEMDKEERRMRRRDTRRNNVS